MSEVGKLDRLPSSVYGFAPAGADGMFDGSGGAEWPRVNFVLLGYNQEEYVRAAVEAAFAQDYPNLEIILSDDCSSDRTFEIMREVAAGYRGPHRVVLNRNAINQKIGGHMNAINRIALAELFVVAHCDDISLPNRTSRIVDRWLKAGSQTGLLHSSCYYIDDRWNERELRGCTCLPALRSVAATANGNSYVLGATSAYSRRLFNLFGDLNRDVVHEDCAASFRSLLAGFTIEYLDEPLVLYRQFAGSSGYYNRSGRHLPASKRWKALQLVEIDYRQKLDDLTKIPDSEVARIVEKRLQYFKAALRFESGIPGWREMLDMSRLAGVTAVIRLIVKRLVNLMWDTFDRDIGRPDRPARAGKIDLVTGERNE